MALPNMPQGLIATVNAPTTGSGPATVALSWTANPQSDGIIEYRVYRTPAAWYVPETAASVVGTSCIDTSGELLPNTAWYYCVVAVNAAGISPPSAMVSAVIPQKQVSLALDGTAHFESTNLGGASCTLSLTTKNANDVIVAAVMANGATVSSISSTHLNFVLRKREQAADGLSDYLELWHAVGSVALSSESITVKLSGNVTYCTVDVFGISGANTSTIFDSNSSLPAAVQSGDVKLSTSNAHDFILGAYRMGHTPTPTAGAGWTRISGSNYQLVQYQIVTATQSNLDVAIGTGSGDDNAGIGDAIMGAS
jgi:hypothetical protein